VLLSDLLESCISNVLYILTIAREEQSFGKETKQQKMCGNVINLMLHLLLVLYWKRNKCELIGQECINPL